MGKADKKPTGKEILHMVKENKISVHPTRMPLTITSAGIAIYSAQSFTGLPKGAAGGWSPQAWKQLFELLASKGKTRKKPRKTADVTEMFEDILKRVENKEMIVHPTRMPITKRMIQRTICNVQEQMHYENVPVGVLCEEGWNYMVKLLGRPKIPHLHKRKPLVLVPKPKEHCACPSIANTL